MLAARYCVRCGRMSRIGKKPVLITAGVNFKFNNDEVVVEGTKGRLSWIIPASMDVSHDGNQVVVTRPTDSCIHRSLHGLTRTIIQNMVDGVSKGFIKELIIEGIGYRAELKGKNIVFALGFSHPVVIEPPEGITFEVPEPTRVRVMGISKELVGEIAARIRRIRKADCYKAKGLRYVGEVVRRKAGKVGGKK